jgi:predicted hotdog family 3-hydroxylacyl-ACP dehydratase
MRLRCRLEGKRRAPAPGVDERSKYDACIELRADAVCAFSASLLLQKDAAAAAPGLFSLWSSNSLIPSSWSGVFGGLAGTSSSGSS